MCRVTKAVWFISNNLFNYWSNPVAINCRRRRRHRGHCSYRTGWTFILPSIFFCVYLCTTKMGCCFSYAKILYLAVVICLDTQSQSAFAFREITGRYTSARLQFVSNETSENIACMGGHGRWRVILSGCVAALSPGSVHRQTFARTDRSLPFSAV